MKKPELLSPVGNMECLKAAVQGGCDAVYLGGYAFGARSFAGNFSNEELIEAITYAHLYGVKVYVTVNTLVYESETEMFFQYIEFLYRNQVDAVIVQDLGMMDWIRKTYPNLEVHASTQMHVHNLEGVKFVQELGLSRVVLARETDIDTIQKIKKVCNIELEIFVHGALCFCYSGQCLMSSMIGGRSGNRGTCTQCCRMKYEIYENDKKLNQDDYVLSPKDLNSLEHLGELIEIGVDSFKIEGRMKRPEYVFYVTHLYRKAIDEYYKTKNITITEEEKDTLKKLFHREFTKGFLFHENQKDWLNPKRPNHVGIPIGQVVSSQNGWVTCCLSREVHQNDGIRILNHKEDKGCILNKIYQNHKLVNSGQKGETISFYLEGKFESGDIIVLTSDQSDLNQIQKQILSSPRKVQITGSITVKIGKCIQYQVDDGINQVTLEGTYVVEKAQKQPVTKERIEEQLEKLGDTVYVLKHLDCNIDDSIFVPIQELNTIRRKMVELLNQKRCQKREFIKKEYEIKVPEIKEEQGYAVTIHSKEEYELIKDRKVKQIYVEDKNLYQDLLIDKRIVNVLPRVMTKIEEENIPTMVGELGSLYKVKPFYTDFSFNVTNSYTVAFLHSLGVKRITLSLEMSEVQIQELVEAYQSRYHTSPNLEYVITSMPEVMITKFDLLNYYHTKNKLQMKDEKKHQFVIQKVGDYTRIYYKKEEKSILPKNIFDKCISTVRFQEVTEENIRYLV